MALITTVPVPNIWDEICKEFESKRPPFEDKQKNDVDLINFDPKKHNPVFYGKMHERIHNIDCDLVDDFDATVSHPACVGHTFVDSTPPSPPKSAPKLPDKDTCPPRDFLEHYIFPYLLPAMEAMLVTAKKERCFERRRTKFNALDFITEYLYKNNKRHPGRADEDLTLFDIPFVQQHLNTYPRPPLPLSLVWTEEEAALVIQSHWRAFMVRRQPEIQELRQWQKEWRQENENIRLKVDDFWADKIDDKLEDDLAEN